jgi:hypothetical protein
MIFGRSTLTIKNHPPEALRMENDITIQLLCLNKTCSAIGTSCLSVFILKLLNNDLAGKQAFLHEGFGFGDFQLPNGIEILKFYCLGSKALPRIGNVKWTS